MAQKRDAGGKFIKGEVDHAQNWDINELKFETPEGVAKYAWVGTIPWRREIRKWIEWRGTWTWATDGYEDVEMEGVCLRCGMRLFVCTTDPVRADDEVGDHLCAYVKNTSVEPHSTYCQACVEIANPALKEAWDNQAIADAQRQADPIVDAGRDYARKYGLDKVKMYEPPKPEAA